MQKKRCNFSNCLTPMLLFFFHVTVCLYWLVWKGGAQKWDLSVFIYFGVRFDIINTLKCGLKLRNERATEARGRGTAVIQKVGRSGVSTYVICCTFRNPWINSCNKLLVYWKREKRGKKATGEHRHHTDGFLSQKSYRASVTSKWWLTQTNAVSNNLQENPKSTQRACLFTDIHTRTRISSTINTHTHRFIRMFLMFENITDLLKTVILNHQSHHCRSVRSKISHFTQWQTHQRILNMSVMILELHKLYNWQ